jgi:hypothetical protein
MSERNPHTSEQFRAKAVAMTEQLRHKQGCPSAHHMPYETYPGGDEGEGEASAIEAEEIWDGRGTKLADRVRCARCGEQIVHRTGETPAPGAYL